MGIQRQNVNALFRTNNLEIIAHAAEVLGVPFGLLVGYVEEKELNDSLIFDVATDLDSYEVTPEEVPTGDTTEDRRMRQEIIKRFYYHWKIKNPDLYKFNDDLGENIYINHTSLVETAGRASLTYLSTLAVLQLDAILQNATLQFVDKPKPGKKKKEQR